MDSFLTPHQLKDVLIEWYSLHPTLVSGQDTRPPESMAMVNLECDDSSILTIPSLSESHRQFNKNMQRQDCLSKIVRRYSPTQIPRKFCDDCVKLLDKELREIFPELPEVTNLSDDIFRTKSIVIASWRMMQIIPPHIAAFISKEVSFFIPPNPLNPERNEFRVLLSILNNGHGENSRSMDLYFKFDKPFQHFLGTLEETTRYCVIPPIDFSEQPNTNEVKGTFSLREETQERSFNKASQNVSGLGSNSFDMEIDSPGTLMSSSRRSSSTLAGKVSRRGVLGYTLDDGPWLWRLRTPIAANTDTKAIEDASLRLESFAGYNRMINAIKKHPNERAFVSMIHSLDQKAIDQCKATGDDRKGGYRELMDDRMANEATESNQFYDEIFDRNGAPYTTWPPQTQETGV